MKLGCWLGAATGIALGSWALRAIANLRVSPSLPISLDLGLDWRVFCYALTAAFLSSLLVGLWPALRIARGNLNLTLRVGGRAGSSGAAHQRLRSVVVAAQLGASLVLLIVAGLFARSLHSVEHVYLGFEPHHLLNVILDAHEIGYDQVRTQSFYQELKARVRALPGIESASLAFTVPMGNYLNADGVRSDSQPTPGSRRH